MPSINEFAGGASAETIFRSAWRGLAATKHEECGVKTTKTLQRFVRQPGYKDVAKYNLFLRMAALAARREHLTGKELLDNLPPEVRSHVEKHGIPIQKDVDSSVIGGNVATDLIPLVFDPEVMDIQKNETPLLDLVPMRGQQGFTAVTNRLDSRTAPLGFRTEAQSADLSAEAEAGLPSARVSVDQKIHVDKAGWTTFAQLGADHYMDLEDTILSQRIAENMRQLEVDLIYGDPTGGAGGSGTGGDDGNWSDARGYLGYATTIEAQGNSVDKSTLSLSGTNALFRDIHAEVKSMIQDPTVGVSPQDLMIWTSHTLFGELERERDSAVRIQQDDRLSFGFPAVDISGVPVIPSDAIRTHAGTDDVDAATTAGDEGDVLIVNRKEAQRRGLMPLTMRPLAVQGWSQQVALGEFAAPLMAADGKLSRYLKAYAVS